MLDAFDALAHPIRRRVLALLRAGEKSAGDLAGHFNVSKPTMSAHFAKLREAGLIHAEQRRGSVIYSLRLSVLEEVLAGFMDQVGIGEPAPVEATKPEIAS